MSKREKAIYVLKLILELAVLVLLILVVIYLIKSKNGILSSIKNGSAEEKLDMAIKTFTSAEGMQLKQVIESIDGLKDLEINEDTGEYKMKIDGQEFIIFSREIVAEPE